MTRKRGGYLLVDGASCIASTAYRQFPVSVHLQLTGNEAVQLTRAELRCVHVAGQQCVTQSVTEGR